MNAKRHESLAAVRADAGLVVHELATSRADNMRPWCGCVGIALAARYRSVDEVQRDGHHQANKEEQQHHEMHQQENKVAHISVPPSLRRPSPACFIEYLEDALIGLRERTHRL